MVHLVQTQVIGAVSIVQAQQDSSSSGLHEGHIFFLMIYCSCIKQCRNNYLL
jgi:hypothetical protein